MATVRVDHAVTSGTFSLDGQTFDVDNNVWIVGDDHVLVVIDAPHSLTRWWRPSAAATCGDRGYPRATTTTSGSPRTGRRTGAPILLHPDDMALSDLVHPGQAGRGAVRRPGDRRRGTVLGCCTRPGTAPAPSRCTPPDLGVVFTGDTLSRRAGCHRALVQQLRHHRGLDPAEAADPAGRDGGAHGHGDSTSIGAEAPHLQEWIDRGTEPGPPRPGCTTVRWVSR